MKKFGPVLVSICILVIIIIAFAFRSGYIYILGVATDVHGGGFRPESTAVGNTSGLVPTMGQITQDGVAVSFLVPQGWRNVRESEASSDMYSPASMAAIDRGDLTTPPDIVVTLIQNSAGKSLEGFVTSYGNGWFLNYAEMRAASVDDHITLMFSDASSTISRSPERAAFVSLESHVVVITAEQSAALAFDEILATLDLVP